MSQYSMRDPLPEHQRVAVLGLGASGQAACKLLGVFGKSVIASDSRSLGLDLGEHVELRTSGNDIGDATAVVVSPGLNPEWPENRDNPALAPIWAAVADGELAIWSEVELAIAAFTGPTITVGGTDGKSTTAAMIRDLLRAAGKNVLFGGNSWTALCEVLAEQKEADVCVAEVSAFQLWAGHALHPNVSVLTNIAPDHLDHYDAEEDYVRAKFHIHANMDAGDTVVLNMEDARLADAAQSLASRGVQVLGFGLEPRSDGRAHVEGGALRWGVESLTTAAVAVPGRHNKKNALCAFLAARAAVPELTVEQAAGALSSFNGLPHRLERVRVLDDVTWFNDSKATNVHAAVTGLLSLDHPIVAIVGGVDKELDLASLIEALKSARAVIAIGDLRARLCAEAAGIIDVITADSLEAAVLLARSSAESGDAVVLAPGCSSFDMFRSFEHRGDVYRELVTALSATPT
ncbi:MAG: UDP-N-acetylmuramoylalanine--D-glutamate ligase [Bradymonadia bacterium]|jgi:UDP-N-acetylmuramoylalanine--D-glutamate ligase